MTNEPPILPTMIDAVPGSSVRVMQVDLRVKLRSFPPFRKCVAFPSFVTLDVIRGPAYVDVPHGFRIEFGMTKGEGKGGSRV